MPDCVLSSAIFFTFRGFSARVRIAGQAQKKDAKKTGAKKRTQKKRADIKSTRRLFYKISIFSTFFRHAKNRAASPNRAAISAGSGTVVRLAVIVDMPSWSVMDSLPNTPS